MNILIIEDEKKTAALLKEMIENEADCLVVNSCQSISSAVSYLTKHQAKLDLIFMDIHLADGESFEIFQQIAINKPVIFCTAFDEYMLQAFKNNGIDYILKPFQQKDIDQALQKVAKLKQSFHATFLPQIETLTPKNYQNSFLVAFREKMIPFEVQDIALFFVKEEHHYALKMNGEQATILRNLDEIEEVLNPALFFRINRQMIINRKAIKDIEPYFNRKVIVNLQVKTPEKLIVSRLKVAIFKEWLEKAT